MILTLHFFCLHNNYLNPTDISHSTVSKTTGIVFSYTFLRILLLSRLVLHLKRVFTGASPPAYPFTSPVQCKQQKRHSVSFLSFKMLSHIYDSPSIKLTQNLCSWVLQHVKTGGLFLKFVFLFFKGKFGVFQSEMVQCAR